MKRMASGTESTAVGSSVPIQLNSMERRERSVRRELAPWLITSGRTRCCRLGCTWRKAAPFGAHTHLWRLPV